MKIGQYDVEFVPRRAIKSQVLTDFIAEWTDSNVRGIGDLPNHWVMYFDGSYTLKGVGVDVVLIPPKGDMLKYAIQIEFSATNNITEYEGLVTVFSWPRTSAFGDSSSEETLSSWPNMYKKNTTATTVRWLII
jgi:hypothetical protein